MNRILALCLLFTACKAEYKSKIFEDCYCDAITIDKPFEVRDLYDNYALQLPDSSWTKRTNSNQSGASLELYKFTEEDSLYISILQSKKVYPWPDEAEQEKELEKFFNVLKKGRLNIDSLAGKWYLVEGGNAPKSLQITFGTTQVQTFYTLALVNFKKDIEVEEGLCILEPILFSFKRFRMSDDLELNYRKKINIIR